MTSVIRPAIHNFTSHVVQYSVVELCIRSPDFDEFAASATVEQLDRFHQLADGDYVVSVVCTSDGENRVLAVRSAEEFAAWKAGPHRPFDPDKSAETWAEVGWLLANREAEK